MTSPLDGLADAAGPLDAADEARRRALLKAKLFGAPADAQPTLRIGRFVVEARLGAGSMGAVYAARDDRLDRRVAIKVLRGSDEPAAQARLLQEARGLARVSHPNVVAVYEVGEVGAQLFIAMELVPGPTLAAWQVGQAPGASGPPRAREILDAYLAAGRGLGAVHAAGLVHRDFKAANVLVGADGRVRVADFGLVRHSGAAPTPGTLALPVDPRLTATGGRVGTPAYMAPEQLLGRPNDHRADQFSFCASLYEALWGVRPFPGDTVAELLVAVGRNRPVEGRAPGVPRAVRRVLLRGLQLDPAARWPDMARLITALEQARRPRKWWFLLGFLALPPLPFALDPDPTPPPDAPPLQAARERMARDPTTAALLLLGTAPDVPGQAELARELLARPLVRQRLLLPGAGVRRLWLGEAGHLLMGLEDHRTLLWSGTPPRGTSPDGALQPLPGNLGALQGVATGDLRTLAQRAAACPPLAVCALVGDVLRIVRPKTPGDTEVLDRFPDGTERTLRRLAGIDPAYLHISQTHDLLVGLTRPGGSAVELSLAGAADRIVPHTEGATTIALGRAAVAVGLADGTVRLWAPGGSPTERTGLPGPVRRLAFSPDDGWLVAVGPERTRIWSRPDRWRDVPGALFTALPVFDPHRPRVLLGRAQGGSLIVDLATGQGQALDQPGEVIQASFGPAGQVATAARDGTVSIWDPEAPDPTQIGRHEARIWSASLSRDRRFLATAGFDGTARVWDLQNLENTRILAGHTAKSLYLTAFSPDGQRLLTGAADGTARIWPLTQAAPPIVLPGHGTWAYALAFSPDGRRVATGDQLGTVRLWTTEGALLATWPHTHASDAARIHTVAFSPDGRFVLGGTRDGLATLWPTSPGAPIALAGHGGRVDVAFAQDGTAVTFAADGQVRRFDTQGRLLSAWPHGAPLYGHAFSADGRRLVVGTLDQAVVVHDLRGSEPSRAFRDLPTTAEAHAFDATGDRLATGTDDGTLLLRDLRHDRPPIRLAGHAGPVRFVGFDAQGTLISAGTDGRVRRWPLDEDVPTLRRRLRAATDLCLTAEQRRAWLAEPPEIAELLASTCLANR